MTALTMWTVYDHPRDVPDVYVARRWSIGRDGVRAERLSITAGSIELLRDHLGAVGLTRLERSPHDDPVIMECWI